MKEEIHSDPSPKEPDFLKSRGWREDLQKLQFSSPFLNPSALHNFYSLSHQGCLLKPGVKSRTLGSALLGSNCPLLLLAVWPWAKYFSSLSLEVLLCKIVIMVISTHRVVEWDNIMHSESTYLLSACCIPDTMLGVRDTGESETDQGAGSCWQ